MTGPANTRPAPEQQPRQPRPQSPPRRAVRNAGQTSDQDDGDMFGDLLRFILQCLPPALSVIWADTKYDRANLLAKILERNQGTKKSPPYLNHRSIDIQVT